MVEVMSKGFRFIYNHVGCVTCVIMAIDHTKFDVIEHTTMPRYHLYI